MKKLMLMTTVFLMACAPSKDLETSQVSSAVVEPETTAEWIDLSKRDKPLAISETPWSEVVITVTNISDIAPFFTQIGGFETVEKTDEIWVLRAPGSDSGYVRLIKIADGAKPARPASSRAWDKGCYFSVMMRAKKLETIIEDAAALGWSPLTEMAYYEFGPSKLHIVVLTHKTGVRVQLYERLTTPLPEGFTPFERISRPFNIMQMVEDRDAGYDFYQQKLGFETFFYGKPYLPKEKSVTPIGIPVELTTTIPYKTGIMTPFKGAEWGRIEMIDIEGMDGGVNYANRCNMNHTGIIAVRIPTEDLEVVRKNLRARKVDIVKSSAKSLTIKTPDGSNIEYFIP